MNQLDFQIQNFMLNLLKKKNKKSIKYLEARLAVNRKIFFDYLKRKDFQSRSKKNPYVVNYWWDGVSKYSTISVITKIIYFLIYFSFVIDNLTRLREL